MEAVDFDVLDAEACHATDSDSHSSGDEEEVVEPQADVSAPPSSTQLVAAAPVPAPSSVVPRSSGSSGSSSKLLSREDVLACVYNLGSAIQMTNQNLNSLINECTTIKETVKKQEQTQEEHTRKIDDIATQLSELQRGQRQVSAVKKSRELRLLLDFIVYYGMDSVNGVVVAFPSEVDRTLCIVVNVVLLHAAMNALCKSQVSAASWRRKEVHLLLSKLDVVDFRKQASTRGTYYDSFQRLFAVEHSSKSKVYDNYVAIEADHFFHAVATARKSTSQLPARVERDVKTHLFSPPLRKVVSVESSKYDEDDGAQQVLDTKMAWGHEVQREVLTLPVVRRFFKRMYELAEHSGERGFTGQDMAVPAAMWEQPSFHFFGLGAVFSNAGRPRMSLVAVNDPSSSSSEEEEEDEPEEDEEYEHTVPQPRGKQPPFAHPGFAAPAAKPHARTMTTQPNAPAAKRVKK